MKAPFNRQAALAFALSAALGFAIWLLSMPITGRSEPWDSEGPYYVVALAVSGVLAGGLVPRPVLAHYLGAIVGQLAYELAFLPMGPLFVLGLAFLAGYGVIFLAGAAVAAALRKRIR